MTIARCRPTPPLTRCPTRADRMSARSWCHPMRLLHQRNNRGVCRQRLFTRSLSWRVALFARHQDSSFLFDSLMPTRDCCASNRRGDHDLAASVECGDLAWGVGYLRHVGTRRRSTASRRRVEPQRSHPDCRSGRITAIRDGNRKRALGLNPSDQWVFTRRRARSAPVQQKGRCHGTEGAELEARTSQ